MSTDFSTRPGADFRTEPALASLGDSPRGVHFRFAAPSSSVAFLPGLDFSRRSFCRRRKRFFPPGVLPLLTSFRDISACFRTGSVPRVVPFWAVRRAEPADSVFRPWKVHFRGEKRRWKFEGFFFLCRSPPEKPLWIWCASFSSFSWERVCVCALAYVCPRRWTSFSCWLDRIRSSWLVCEIQICVCVCVSVCALVIFLWSQEKSTKSNFQTIPETPNRLHLCVGVFLKFTLN